MTPGDCAVPAEFVSRRSGLDWQLRNLGHPMQCRPVWLAVALVGLLWGSDAQSEKLDPIPIVVSEYSSTVWVRSSLWDNIRVALGMDSWDCFTLRVFPTNAVAQLQVTSRGLGAVRFAESCGSSEDVLGETSLKLGPLTESGVRLAVHIDASHPARTGVPLVGELVFVADGFEPTPVKIEFNPQPIGEFQQAIAWTLGIGVPALVTFGLGLWAQRIKGRRDAEDQFFRTRFSRYSDVEEFFRDYYATFLDKENFTQLTYEKLVEQNLFEPIPPHYAKPILKSLEKGDSNEFKKALQAAFPEFMSHDG